MNEREELEHELIKNILKLSVINNQTLTDFQKQQAINNIDQAAQQADWLVEMLKRCEYIV